VSSVAAVTMPRATKGDPAAVGRQPGQADNNRTCRLINNSRYVTLRRALIAQWWLGAVPPPPLLLLPNDLDLLSADGWVGHRDSSRRCKAPSGDVLADGRRATAQDV
jgi:hypothetical protein